MQVFSEVGSGYGFFLDSRIRVRVSFLEDPMLILRLYEMISLHVHGCRGLVQQQDPVPKRMQLVQSDSYIQ
mgnify:CR=1 FL=1